MKKCLLIITMSLAGCIGFAQTAKSTAEKWETLVDDGDVTISYNTNITTNSRGNHFVWVRTQYHTSDWQYYFANQIGSQTPVFTTRTKAEYQPDYKYTRVRQVICYSKAGKKLYDTGDDTSAGWGPVNASDPVGIVGEYLWDKSEKERANY